MVEIFFKEAKKNKENPDGNPTDFQDNERKNQIEFDVSDVNDFNDVSDVNDIDFVDEVSDVNDFNEVSDVNYVNDVNDVTFRMTSFKLSW